ncbi:MAG: phosphoribosylglycinamide formyltransferase [Actinobacteria bacterium]|jgi:phosphoribosylglycinamide formyltransferase-1|nr:phosphoribosylglycinamide formyltransferase [Actinomycetota bacterium]MBT3688402.1 phosphoribosylglycinamide formyltransferase [Actinomycetota bacterium]MBT4037300.1 phosphoribosylglycinamide formyltransferase [Actinomycetota bacterium]MBT4278701.1 phosphoribosylglycinamide formyltransferase [Actinomycetota bacterium]MBT4343459.1 phosphoribosylglycinamide formyltransferase [Actinomycetota bacterium]
MRLAVLASGTGSILEAIVDAGLPVHLMVTDRPCRALDLAASLGIPTRVVERASFGDDFDRDTYTVDLVDVLAEAGTDLVAMAGFGTILAQPAYDRFAGRILNTHPALLPSFPGWHAVADAMAHGVKVTGCTVHIATLEVDSGPILAQEAVPVLPDDDEGSLHERIKAVERHLYPETIRAVMENRAVLMGEPV